MCWAMIFVMACGSSVTNDYTHNPSITRYYVLSYDICHGVWWFSHRRLYTQSQHYTVLCTELWYLSLRVVVQLQTIIHTILALHGIMYWAMISVMACGSSVTDDYTHNPQHYTVLCAELWYLSWCVVVQSQTIIHTISTLHGIMCWAMIFVMAICHGVWWFSNRRLYTQSQHYTVLCTELWYLSWRVVV